MFSINIISLSKPTPPEIDIDELQKMEEIHPLFNSVILDLIFNHVPKSSWKSVRLVNKVWHLELLPRWRDQMSVCLEKTSLSKIPLTHNCITDHLIANHPSNNPKDPYQFNHLPFRTLRVYYVPFGLEHSTFLTLYGPWLKRLNLSHAIIPGTEFLKNLLFDLTPNLYEFHYDSCKLDNLEQVETNNGIIEYIRPSKVLKNLKVVSILVLHPEENVQPFPISWINLFSVFQHIKTMRLNFYPVDKASVEIANVIKTIGVIRKANQNQVLNITDLILPSEIHVPGQENMLSLETITDLCNLSLPLASLATILPENPDGLAKIMTTHRHTLKRLKFDTIWWALSVFQWKIVSVPYHVFPPGLTKLDTQSSNLMPTLGFLANTPNLVELRIRTGGCNHVVKNLKEMKIAPLVYLTSLDYLVRSGVNGELAQMLVKLMPNVTRLNINADGNGFREICDGWGKLRDGRFSIHGLTEQCFVDHVTKLKCLRFVNVHITDIFNVLADQSIYEGFLRLPLLTKVSAQFSIKVSKDALRALKKAIADTKAVFTDSMDY